MQIQLTTANEFALLAILALAAICLNSWLHLRR